MNKLMCPNCNKQISPAVLSKHLKPCKLLTDNKELLIQRYNSNVSLKNIKKEFHIDTGLISDFLKKNGVRVKSDENGQYKNHNNINEHYFENIDSNEKAWLLGLFAADGNVKKNNRGVSISQSGENGLKLIQYIKKLLKINNNIYEGKTIGENTYAIQAHSSTVANQLAQYNIVPKKSLIYTFPEKLPKKYYASFIRGYIEGDGCIGVYSNTKGCKYMCVSFVGTPTFIKRCYEIIPIKGIFSKCSGSKKVLELRWNGKTAKQFCEWIFSDDTLYKSYKFEKYKSHINWLNDNPTKYMKYDSLKEKALLFIKMGYNCMKIGKELGIPFQTIYKWKDRYENKPQ